MSNLRAPLKLRAVHNQPIHPADVVASLPVNAVEGVKITFINMPLREFARPNNPPEGPGLLAAILRRHGAIPAIVDLNGYRIQDDSAQARGLKNGRLLTLQEAENMLVEHLRQAGDQDVIALSGMITTLRWQQTMAAIVRRHQPDCLLISGGGLATEIKTGLFQWIPELDGVARSEGDDVILAIAWDAKQIRDKGLAQAVRAGHLTPYHIGEYLGRERFVYEGNRPRNLDDLPFAAWDLLERDPFGDNLLEGYLQTPVWGGTANNSSAAPFIMTRSLTTVSSRGCPYACSFCYRGAQGERYYGMRSAEHLARQMREYIDKYQVDFIGFPDDNFAVDKKRIKRLPEVFREFGIAMRWGTHTRMDEADERLWDMRAAGCIYIGFGAESASTPVLNRMQKGGFILKNGVIPTTVNGNVFEFPATMVNAIQNCRKADVHGNCTWIMAYPGETLRDLQTSVAFILWQLEVMTNGLTAGTQAYQIAHDAVNQRMFTATAYPGTAMFKDPAVAELLQRNFAIQFESNGEPVCDDAFYQYVLELDDATKVLHNLEGEPLNFGALPLDKFLQAREYADNGQLYKILEMT